MPCIWQKSSACGKQNHLKAISKLTWQQPQDQNGGKMTHDIGQEGDLCIVELEEQDRKFDAVRVKYLNIDTIKSITFTKLESSTSQRQTCIVYIADTGADGNSMPLKMFQNTLSQVKIRRVMCHKKIMLWY